MKTFLKKKETCIAKHLYSIFTICTWKALSACVTNKIFWTENDCSHCWDQYSFSSSSTGDKYMRECHSVHSRSKDLARGIKGLPKEVSVSCGSLWRGNWQERKLTGEAPRKRSYYYYSLYLFHFVQLYLLFLFLFLTFIFILLFCCFVLFPYFYTFCR